MHNLIKCMYTIHMKTAITYVRCDTYTKDEKKTIYVGTCCTAVCDWPSRWYYLFFTYLPTFAIHTARGFLRWKSNITDILTKLCILEFPVTYINYNFFVVANWNWTFALFNIFWRESTRLGRQKNCHNLIKMLSFRLSLPFSATSVYKIKCFSYF